MFRDNRRVCMYVYYYYVCIICVPSLAVHCKLFCAFV